MKEIKNWQWFQKIISAIVILAFSSLQILPPGFAESFPIENQIQSQISEKPVQENIAPNLEAQLQVPHGSIEFLQNDSPLSLPVPEEYEISNQNYEYERYDFEDALDLLRPEYASAAIVKSLSIQDVKKLLGLSFEVGVVVLHGEIVLFTSGSTDEIGVLPAVKELVGEASFIS